MLNINLKTYKAGLVASGRAIKSREEASAASDQGKSALKLLACLLTLTGFGAETDQALLESQYRSFEEKCFSAGYYRLPMESEEFQWLFEHGPAVLSLIYRSLESADDKTNDPYVTLFECCSRAFLYGVTSNPSTVMPRAGNHLRTDDDDLLAIPNDRGGDLRMSWPAYVNQYVLAWRDKAPRILKRPDAFAAISCLPIRMPLEKVEVTPELRAERERISAYGIYNLPRFVRVIGEGENGLIFQLFLFVARPNDENSGVYGDVLEKAQTVAQRFPTLESRLNVVRTWWREDSWKYEVLPDLYKAIQAEMDRLDKAGSE